MFRGSTIILNLIFVIVLSSCQQKEVITVFHAGSLAIPFHEMAKEFQDANPGIVIRLEGAGSLTCIRKITELNKPCDVLAVADYALIDELMIPDHADYNVLFAGNRLAIGYRNDTDWKGLISSKNWHQVLMQENVHFGRSDPDHDPSGYRTEIMAGLAEKYYQMPGLQKRLLAKDRKFIRPKGTEILPLLETGTIDFIFHYQSVLVQHGLGVLSLSDSLDLSNPDLDAWYASACVSVRGAGQDERILKCGEAMVYGACLPHNGKNPEAAEEFFKFMITRGRDILEKNGQPATEPMFSEKSINIPEWCNRFIH